jgi:membrane-associated phospholipid phosphatase
MAIMLEELQSPLPIAVGSLTSLAVTCVVLITVAGFYQTVRPRENFAISCMALVQAILFSAAGSILSYLLARRTGATWDSTLQRWDELLGFDWLAFVGVVDAHPWAAAILRMSYASLIPQIIAIVVALGFGYRFNQLQVVILGAMLAGTATIFLSPFFPAYGNYLHRGLSSVAFKHVHPWAGYAHAADLNGLRTGHFAILDLSEMQGIITFPSYHAALATVTAWGFWNSGNAPLRWGGSIVSVTTIIATPVDGGHYLVDVLAGIAIAVVSVIAAKHLIRPS